MEKSYVQKNKFLIWLCLAELGIITALCAITHLYRVKDQKYDRSRYKDFRKKKLFNEWLYVYQRGMNIGKHISDQGIRTAAIYGYTEVGERLADDLISAGITINGIIDNKLDLCAPYKVFSSKEQLPDSDICIVTVTDEFEDIKKQLSDKGVHNIQSLEDIIYEIRGKTDEL